MAGLATRPYFPWSRRPRNWDLSGVLPCAPGGVETWDFGSACVQARRNTSAAPNAGYVGLRSELKP